MQIFTRPLVDQVIGDNEHGFTAKPQPLTLLRCGYHRKGLPCTHNMGEKRISAIKNTGNCVCLMVTELYFRGHPIEANVFAAELAGTNAVELLIIELAKPFAPIGVFPYPFLKFTADLFLLALRNRGFLLVQHRFFITVFVLNIIKDAHILEIEGILDNVVRIHSGSAVYAGRFYISFSVRLICNPPLSRNRFKLHLHTILIVVRNFKKLKNECLYIFRRNPCGTEPDPDFRRCQIFRLYLFQRFHINGVIIRGLLSASPCHCKFFADIAGKILICRQVFVLLVVSGPVKRIEKNNASEIGKNFCFAFPCQFAHIVHIHKGVFPERNRQRLACRIHTVNGQARVDGSLGENIRLFFQIAFLVQLLKRA